MRSAWEGFARGGLTISFAAEADAAWVESVVRSSVLLPPEGH